eukprot:Rmarinus@m.25927
MVEIARHLNKLSPFHTLHSNDAKLQGRYGFALWAALHANSLIAICVLDGAMKDAFENDVGWAVVYFLFMALNIFCYYYLWGSNPGYVLKPTEKLDVSTESGSLLVGNEPGDVRECVPLPQDQKEAGGLVVRLKRCNRCDMMQPIRVKHCRDCRRCVFRFDHHCFWVGTCVGRKNHRRFWVFLLTETFMAVWTSYLVWTTFADEDEIDDWVGANVYQMLTFGFNAMFALLPTMLFSYHTYLMSTNQTTWESVSHESITYLQEGPKGFLPFNRGFVENLKAFWMDVDIPPRYTVPDYASHYL